ncbi:hypothetical protein Tco_1010267 [Tanacetum coccineum]
MLLFLVRNLTELLLIALLVPLRGTRLLLLFLMCLIKGIFKGIRLLIILLDLIMSIIIEKVGESGLVYENCGFNGHIIDRCFKLIGYYADFGKKKSRQNFKGINISNNNIVGSSSSTGFTDEQMSNLISLIKDTSLNGKNVKANMTCTLFKNSRVFNENFKKFFCSNTNIKPKLVSEGKIVDLGENQHMNHTDKELDNVYDISHLRIKVGHPNGIEAFISNIRNIILSNGLVLYDVLVILEYYVTLSLVHKVAKDNKILVAFNESRCYILNQEMNLKNVLGIGD